MLAFCPEFPNLPGGTWRSAPFDREAGLILDHGSVFKVFAKKQNRRSIEVKHEVAVLPETELVIKDHDPRSCDNADYPRPCQRSALSIIWPTAFRQTTFSATISV
jgi:hypothetical protein